MVTSSIVSTGKALARPSRRRMLVGCVGLAAAASLAPWARAAVFARRREGELFAFTAPDRSDLVFALAMAPLPLGQAERDRLSVRLHAGASSWTVEPYALREADASHNGARMFSGRVRCTDSGDKSAVHLVAVAVPAERMAAGRLDVWAEVIGADGRLARIGNPVMSELLAGDAGLARLHAELHPTTDRRLLAAAITRRIAAGKLDPDAQARARRLADFVLPDTLCFDRAHPEGFTFAAMNGRRPDDAVAPIVQTLLVGVPRTGEGDGRFRSSSQFPYFAIA